MRCVIWIIFLLQSFSIFAQSEYYNFSKLNTYTVLSHNQVNAILKDTDPYTGNTRKAWHGRALAVIRSTHSVGDIKLTVSSPGLSEATLNIKTISDKN